jgi:hypothetical protein
MEKSTTARAAVMTPNHKEDSEALRAEHRDSHPERSANLQGSRHPVAGLQATFGNRAVQHLLSPLILQRSRAVAAPDGIHEKESDAVAEQVTVSQSALAAAGASGSENPNSPRSLAREAPQRSTPQSILRRTPIHALQQGLGNRAVARLFQQTPPAPAAPKLSRKCACGGDAKEKEECAECSKSRLALQRISGSGSISLAPLSATRDVRDLLGDPPEVSARITSQPNLGRKSNHGRSSSHLPVSQAEMVPGYFVSHAIPTVGSRLPLSIQRAKIDYRALTWDDFQGKAPKGSTFDAETASDFVDPDLKAAMAKVVSTDTGESCKAGGKAATKFKADITIDPDKVLVKSFMWQEKSWKQDWLTDDAAARKHCEKSSPICEKEFDDQFKEIKKQRADEEKKCRDFFDDAKKKANEDCKKNEQSCQDAFDNGSSSFSLDTTPPVTASSKKECTTQLLPGCVKATMDSQSFSTDDGAATAKTRAECGKEFGDAFEKLAKDATTVKMFSSDKSVSVTVDKRADCRGSFLDDCGKTLTPPNRDYLLSHEQRHFDLTDAMAKKATSDLRDLISSFKKEAIVIDCGQAATESKAKATLDGERSKLQKHFTDSQKALAAKQKQYDDETKHSVNLDKQKEWSAVIDKGFLKTP